MTFRKPFKEITYSKDSRYVVSRCADLEEQGFILVDFFLKESNFRQLFARFFSKFSRYVDFHELFMNFLLILCGFYVHFVCILPFKVA